MNQNEIVQSVRAEIAKLQRVLELLLGQPTDAGEARRSGGPKGSGNRATSIHPEEGAPKKRTMSAEGKARIAAAQKKRWAAQKAASREGNTRKKAIAPKRSSETGPAKSARKVVPVTAKKSTGAGKRTGSTQAGSRSASAGRSATKRPTKQAAPAAP